MNLPVMPHLMCWLEAERVFLCLAVQKRHSLVILDIVIFTRARIHGCCL